MERTVSIYGSSSALRGVQLKIGEKFKPPAKVTLPVGWKTRDPSRLLSLSYDFSLEEEVIKKTEAEREAREQQQQAQKLEELFKTSATNPVVANMAGDILQPTTAATSTTMSNSLNTNDESKRFNYKDFEDNADTPFETVELQCIDNMDALKSILQPNVGPDAASSTSGLTQIPQETNSISIPGTGTQLNSDVASYSLETSFPVSSSPVQITNRYSRHADETTYTPDQTIPQGSNPFAAQNPLLVDTREPMTTGLESVSTQSNVASCSAASADSDRKISLPGAMRVLPVAPARPPPRRPKSVPNENMTSERIFNIADKPPTQKRPVPKPRSKLPPLKDGAEASTPVPPTYLLPSDSPPPLPPKKSAAKKRNMKKAEKPDVFLDDVNLKRYPSPLPAISPTKQHAEPPSYGSLQHVDPPAYDSLQLDPPTNDPRATMSSEEVQFVNQISAMGFPVGRVARAVKNLGCKEREVIEFLISVNDMCTLGYNEVQVEMVLKDNSDQTKAVEFLKLIAQFKELGFQEEKIFEALKKSECDSNKTLDILTCAG